MKAHPPQVVVVTRSINGNMAGRGLSNVALRISILSSDSSVLVRIETINLV